MKNLVATRLGILVCVSLSTVLLLQGCALSLDHWKGKRKSTLISTWGTPEKTISDRKGGKILVYNRTPRETNVSYLGNYTPPTRRIGFYVNKKGVIYGWKELPLGKTLYK